MSGNILYAFVGFGVGAFFSFLAMHHTFRHNRKTEHLPNQTVAAPSSNEMAWHVVHIRDDIGSICVLLALTNGLLAALIAVLILPGL